MPEYEHYESQLGDNDYQNEINSIEKLGDNKVEDDELSSDEEDFAVLSKAPYHHIIIDCSPLNYIDTVGVKTLNQVIKEKFNFCYVCFN